MTERTKTWKGNTTNLLWSRLFGISVFPGVDGKQGLLYSVSKSRERRMTQLDTRPTRLLFSCKVSNWRDIGCEEEALSTQLGSKDTTGCKQPSMHRLSRNRTVKADPRTAPLKEKSTFQSHSAQLKNQILLFPRSLYAARKNL